jgi:transcription elongation factor GreA
MQPQEASAGLVFRRPEFEMPTPVRIPVTRAGAAALRSELKRLKSVERPRVIEALEVARSHGDLSENADYDAAKDRQAFIEGRIQELEDKLSRAEIVDVGRLTGTKAPP